MSLILVTSYRWQVTDPPVIFSSRYFRVGEFFRQAFHTFNYPSFQSKNMTNSTPSIPTPLPHHTPLRPALRLAVLVLLSALAWAVLAYIANGTYLLLAIGIGVVIATAVGRLVTHPTWPVALLLFFPAALLTAVTILLGDYLFYIFVLMSEGTPFTEAIGVISARFVELSAVDTITALIYALIGTLIGHIFAMLPQS